jgi:hypothetical protein
VSNGIGESLITAGSSGVRETIEKTRRATRGTMAPQRKVLKNCLASIRPISMRLVFGNTTQQACLQKLDRIETHQPQVEPLL